MGTSNSRSRSASSKETGDDRKGHEATFSGTTKESAPPTESVEKQLETENIGTSQGTLRPVDVAVKESTSQQLGGQTAGDGDEASQSQLCEPSASDDTNKSFSTDPSLTGDGAADEESYDAPVSTKEANKGSVRQSTDVTQEVSSSTTSVEKQLEVEDTPIPADITDKESVHALSPLLSDSQTMSGQPKLRINPSTGGKLVSASTGANSDQISHRSKSHQDGSSVCLRTSSSTAQLSVLSAEAANNKLETKVNEASPGVMRLSDVRPLSEVDSLLTATGDSWLDKSSTDNTKPSPSTATSTAEVSGSHRSGAELSDSVAMDHTHSTDNQQDTQSAELQVPASATTDKLDVKLTKKEFAKLLELIHTYSSKWELIGVLLGFAPSELENIKSMPSLFMSAPTSFLKELLSRWIQWPTLRHPTKPTLRVLCTSLRSSIIGLGALADEVEREMMQAITGLTPQVGDDGQTDDNVCSALEEFENRFDDLHQKIRDELVAGRVDTSDVLSKLTLLPLKLKEEYDKPIQEIFPVLNEQKNINELFCRLNPLLSFLDYALLEHIINKFGSDQLKKTITAYGSDIQVFMQQTTIQQLMDHLPGQPEIPRNFELIKAKIGKDAKKCTIAEINQLRRRLCCEIRLSKIVFHIIALEDSNSFIIFFIVPSVLLPDVFESARKLHRFFQRESIVFFCVSNSSPKLLRFGAQLKERYQQSLVSVSPSELIPSPTKKIFRLAMIQRESVQQGQIEDAFVRMSISGKVDDILRAKIPVELKDILRHSFHGGEIVLVEGAPGSGKSTFTVHVCKKWGRGELFEQFSVVILVQLRDPAVQRAKSIADLLPCQDVAVAQEYASEIIATNGRGILWVLDGWDELPPHLQQDSIFRSLLPSPHSDQQLQQIKQDLQYRRLVSRGSTNEELWSVYLQDNPSFRAKLFNQKYLNESSVIVTSRPISSGDIHPVVSSRIEVLGFTPEEQRQYFTECLKGDSQALRALLQKIKENPVVQSICYLPLNAAFVVHTFKYKGRSLPSTVYEIYLSVITSIVSRHFSREGKSHDLPRERASLADLSRSRVAGKDFQRLCEMAHRGVMQNKVTFSSSEFPEGSSTLSLLQGIESFLEGGKSVFYNFLHLIIQEIMSAYHMATQLSDSEQVSQFQQLFDQPRFAAVFQFYSVITKLETPGIRDVVSRMAKKRSGTHLVSLLRCLYEAQDPSLCLYVAEQLSYQPYLNNTSLSPLDCLSLSFFLFSIVSNDQKYAEYSFIYVSLSRCNIDDLGANCLTKYLIGKINHSLNATFVLSNNNINEEGASYIAKMLCSSNIVKQLNLSHNPIGDTGASFISNAVRETTSLKTLNVYRCKITSQGAKELSRALVQNGSLEKLDIGWNEGVGDEGIMYIAEALEHNKQLNELHINDCGITDKGAAYLASALSVNNSVKLLDMRGNLTQSGLSKLTRALSHNTGLIKLAVSDDLSSITKQYEQKLNETREKVGLPPIKIEVFHEPSPTPTLGLLH